MRYLPYLATAIASAALTLLLVWLANSQNEIAGAPSRDAILVAGSAVEEPTAAPTLRGSPDRRLANVQAHEWRFLEESLLRERERIQSAKIRPSDSGLDVLERVIVSRADPGLLLGAFERFQAHVTPAAAPKTRFEATGDETIISRKEKPNDPWVIELGPGRFRFDNVFDYGPHMMNDVESLEIRGAGMDQTTLFARSDLIQIRNSLKHLRMSDFTFETSGQNLVDSRGDVACVLERVRLEGVAYSGSNGSLYLQGRYYLGCRDCEFRNLSEAARVFGEGLAIFENCIFQNAGRGFTGRAGAAQGSRIALLDCEWHDCAVANRGIMYRGEPEYEVQVRGGRVAMARAGLPDEERRQRWGEPWVVLAGAPSLGSSETRLTLRAMSRILEGAPLESGQLPTAIRVLEDRHGSPALYLLTVFDSARQSKKAFDVWVEGDAVQLRTSKSSGDRKEPPEGALPLAEVIRRCGEPSGTPCDRIEYDLLWNKRSEKVQAVSLSWKGSKLYLAAEDASRVVTPWPSDW